MAGGKRGIKKSSSFSAIQVELVLGNRKDSKMLTKQVYLKK
jgi:hypothetical protein